MAITERRRQFLQVLHELYKEKNRPIHYYEIAKKVKVSPATAYDILQLLYKEGYVETIYEEDSLRKRGRKKVFFKPKEEKGDLFEINIDRTNALLLCTSFLLFLIKKLKWSEDLKNYVLFLLGSNLKINIDYILLAIPLLIIGYIGKSIFEGIDRERIRSTLEDYWRSLTSLADEEKRALFNLIISTVKSI